MTAADHPSISRRTILKSGAAGSVAASLLSSPSSAQNADPATYVLVHPAWLGGWCWPKVTARLRTHGHTVYTPTLTGLGERIHLADPAIGLATHIDDVVNLLEFEDLNRVILVGNSSGGMVITGAADRVPERLASVVYLDAFVPEDGQSLVDLLSPERRQGMEQLVNTEGQGWLLPRFGPLPWEEIVRGPWGVTAEEDIAWLLARLASTPFKHFTDPVTRSNPAVAQLNRVYIRCTLFPQPVFDRHAQMAQETAGWHYRELATPHLPYITHPEELSEVLLGLAASSER
jgi:pimeloyl-ACP methyl ester carboxylesterase